MTPQTKLEKFLSLVKIGYWRAGRVPRCWSHEYRTALSDGLVTVGWGGSLTLSEAGNAHLSQISGAK